MTATHITATQLRGYRDLRGEVLQLEQTREEWNRRLEARPGNPKLLAKLNTLVAYLDDRRDELITMAEDIELALDKLPPLERRVLREYYIVGTLPRRWLQVAQALHYSVEHVKHVHGKAIKQLAANG